MATSSSVNFLGIHAFGINHPNQKYPEIRAFKFPDGSDISVIETNNGKSKFSLNNPGRLTLKPYQPDFDLVLVKDVDDPDSRITIKGQPNLIMGTLAKTEELIKSALKSPYITPVSTEPNDSDMPVYNPDIY